MFIISKKLKKNFNILNRSYNRNINISILLPCYVLGTISLLMLYSAGGGSIYPWMWKQALYFGIFGFIGFFIARLNTNILYRIVPIFYILSIVLLMFVLVFGYASMGAKRWIDLKIIKIQPSEIAKLSTILMLARVFHSTKFNNKILDIKLLIPLSIIALPVGLTVMQPDLATGIVILAIGGIVCFLCGTNIKIFLMLIFGVLASMPIIWNNMHDYQKARIHNFFSQEGGDKLAGGYNLMQSKVAIGSGGIFGKGLIKGTQSQLNFLPENQTDFIFTMIAEEMGLIGCVVVMLCYWFIMEYGISLAMETQSIFGKALTGGIVAMLLLHFTINASMVTGLVPVAGIPMPFLSYGGSSIAVNTISIGLLIHIDANKRAVYFL